MVETGVRMGKKVVALITDMNQPLGRMAGHSNEIAECIDVLGGGGPADLVELSLELSAWMFFLGDRTKSLGDGRLLAEAMISTGEAKEKFKQAISLQGGNERIVDDPQLLPQARSQVDVPSPSTGFITRTNCEQLGTALATLGGGREKKEDSIDHAVGLEFHKRIGDRVEKGEPLATIHYNSGRKLAEAESLIAASYEIGEARSGERLPLIRRIIGA
jgi:pyrimidine-nucleoside phosphorylase